MTKITLKEGGEVGFIILGITFLFIFVFSFLLDINQEEQIYICEENYKNTCEQFICLSDISGMDDSYYTLQIARYYLCIDKKEPQWQYT